MKLYKAKLKSRKQIMAEIPREQQGWWADVCAGQTLTLRDATAADVARCIINEGQSRDPADYLCEACERGSLVRRIAIKELTEIADRRAPSSAPTAGSIDSDELTDLMELWADAQPGPDAYAAYKAIIAHIDTWAGRSAGDAVCAETVRFYVFGATNYEHMLGQELRNAISPESRIEHLRRLRDYYERELASAIAV